jgi:ATP-dependent Clp protease ATP-binding subunit ClpC
MFERFSDQARRVVVLAAEQARDLNHPYIGTEHLLLGLIAEGQGPAAQVLATFGVAVDGVRSQIEVTIGRGKRDPHGHIPFTPQAKKVLELSVSEAERYGHEFVGTGHMLLAVQAAGNGLASDFLTERGATATEVRARIERDFGSDPSLTGAAEQAGTGSAGVPGESLIPASLTRPPHATGREILPLVTAIERRLTAIEEQLGMSTPPPADAP